MPDLLSVAKWIGAPGSAGFFALCGAIGFVVATLVPRGGRIARVWLALVSALYLVAALPVVSYALANMLPAYAPVWRPSTPKDLDILVILSGDNPAGRAREARRVLEASKPRCVLVSGGPWFVRMVAAAGIDRNLFAVDDTTATTREQVAKLGLWADQCGARRVILVASALSMPRIAPLTESLRVEVVLAPSPPEDTPPTMGIRFFLPSWAALRMTKDALYEHLALAYYRHNNWID